MKAITIRHAKEDDVSKIYNLGKKINELGFSKKFPFHERSELKEFIKNKKENIFLVAVSDEITGFLYARILSKHARGWCMLDNLAVDGKYRNYGVGTLLLKELYKILRKRKVNYIQVLENINHKKTRKFWKDKGFKETKIFVWAEKTI